MAFKKIEHYDDKIMPGLMHHYRESLKLLGEDPEREGLEKTPERVAKAMQYMMQGYDQDGWAREFHYDQVPLAAAMDQLRSLRNANLGLWSRLTSDQLQRVGIHSERGPERAGHILRLMGAHDLVHRRQIDRILASAR